MTLKFIDSLPKSSVEWLPPDQHWAPPKIEYFQEIKASKIEEKDDTIVKITQKQPKRFLDRIEEKYPLFYGVFKPQLEENIIQEIPSAESDQLEEFSSDESIQDTWYEERELETTKTDGKIISYWQLPPEETFEFVTFEEQDKEINIGFNYTAAENAMQFARQLQIMQQSFVPSEIGETGFTFNIRMQSPIDYIKEKAKSPFKRPVSNGFGASNSNENKKNSNQNNQNQNKSGGYKGKKPNNQKGKQKAK